MTPWAVYLDSGCWKFFRDTNREYMLSLTEYSRACTECTLHEFLSHLCEAMRWQYKSSMDYTIEIHSRLVYLKKMRIVKVFRIWAVTSKDHLHCFPRNQRVKKQSNMAFLSTNYYGSANWIGVNWRLRFSSLLTWSARLFLVVHVSWNYQWCTLDQLLRKIHGLQGHRTIESSHCRFRCRHRRKGFDLHTPNLQC